MFDRLAEFIGLRAKEASSTEGISPSHAYLYHAGEGTYGTQEAQELNEEYEQATISLPYAEVEKLDPKSFRKLQETLQKSVLESSRERPHLRNQGIMDFIKPGTDRNVLSHEADHIKGLPDQIKRRARIDVTFIRDDQDQISIDGTAIFDMDTISDYDRALSSSEPASLSETDILIARNCAVSTGDKKFQNKIEKRIRARSKH